MSFTNYDTALVRQYEQAVLMRAQQMESRTRPFIQLSTNVQGEMVFFNQYGTATMQSRTSRLADLNVQDTSFQRRAAVMQDFEVTNAVDPFDLRKGINDPMNPVVLAQGAAMGRQLDSIVTSAAFAAALSGKSGSGTSSFPGGNVVAVNEWGSSGGSGNSGLTVPKVLRANRLLDANGVPNEGRVMFVSAKAMEDLLSTTEATSTLYNNYGREVAALVRGDVQFFGGFTFVKLVDGLLPVDGSSYTRVIAMHREAIGLGIALENTRSNVFIDEKKGGAPTAYTLLSAGAVRVDDNRIIEIKCV
jgi:hypothetical protein